jgi:hypothetical protein
MGAASTEQKTGKTLFSMKTNADTLMQQNTAAQVSRGAEGGVPAPNPEAQKAAVAAGTQPTVDVIAQQTEQAKINAQTQISVQKANNKIIESDAKVRVKADADAATMMYTQLNELLAMTGLSLEFLNDIAESNRTVTDVKLDGSKVGSLLNEVTRKQFGVVRATT